MTCKKCGAEAPDDAKFCIQCGNNLEEQRVEEAKEAPEPSGDPAVEESVEKSEAESSDIAESSSAAETEEAASDEAEEPKADAESQEPENQAPEAPAFTCPNCGAEILPGDKFCTKCGATLVAPEPQAGQQAPVQAPAQQPMQQPPVQQQIPYQQPVQQPYYGQPAQYQQPMQYPPQYAQPQQPQYPPQYTQPQQPAPEKPKRGKTPFWVWIIVGVLAAALIFCIVWFFVVPNVGNSGNNGAAQSGQAADSGPSRVDVNDDSEYARQAEKELGESAESTIRDTTSSWRNQRLLSNVVADDYFWDGNSLVVIVDVSINYEATYFNPVGTYYKWYYTYVRYNNVYYEDGSIHYEDSSRPHGRLLNLYTDTSGDHHYVSGYSSEEAARSAAGV